MTHLTKFSSSTGCFTLIFTSKIYRNVCSFACEKQYVLLEEVQDGQCFLWRLGASEGAIIILSLSIFLAMAHQNKLASQNLSNLNTAFQTAVLASSLWQSIGYVHDGLLPANDADRYIIKFNSNNNRTIELGIRNGEIFTVTILRETNEEAEFNYEGGHTYFFMSNWLSRTGYPYSQYPFYASSYTGSFEEKVQSFLQFLETAFHHPTLEGTIMGTEWGYFPFDWGTLK